MAPSRRRGANKGKAKEKLKLGDLVLAKVKGFPAWPAKVRALISSFFNLRKMCSCFSICWRLRYLGLLVNFCSYNANFRFLNSAVKILYWESPSGFPFF